MHTVLVRYAAGKGLAERVGAGDAISFRVKEVHCRLFMRRMYLGYSDLLEVPV